MAKPAFLFDLDMTLLDTSALQDARKQQKWQFVAANLHLAKPYSFPNGPTVHEVPGQLKAMGHPVGIVTSSPRPYAKALLKRFQVPYDALVAGTEVPAKPNPDPIQKALKDLKVKPANAYYVGDAYEDFEASYRAGVRSIGAGWNPEMADLWKTAPDIWLHYPRPLLDPSTLHTRGYLAEVIAAGHSATIHPGSVLQCGAPDRVALGRYFSSKDPRHAEDRLTQLILTLKEDDAPAKLFGRALASYLKFGTNTQFSHVTCVPPKPGKPRIRFAATLQQMNTYGKAHYSRTENIVPDGLRTTKNVEGYKQANYDLREALINDAFASKIPSWANGNVLLLDDVLTSGATSGECARVLKASRAGNVHIVCLGADQNPFVTHPCPECLMGSLKRRTSVYGVFWSCSRYKKDGSGCRYKQNFAPQ
ncbi:HAD-IA family hydrolase [Pyxidicoccus sp. MSG2]|uniref:HAD-IA family hydrolase n=1 Tax=Pyxidicoccus sp. MSG2 TaxID=2996790 RepID=UPI00226EAD13|nr:HAD-IA family hydrolase [Pyxidicoccus sp. MSG2]MCY1018259.1 HAD-IA family hydrolase [Pyxidicoccus sp. MSG2]